MPKVASLLERDSNIFDSLRLIAAIMVIYSHSFALAGFEEPKLQGVSLGALGVRIFFILSGLLITASWVSHPRFAAYIGKRALRIVPALAVTIIATLFILGPVFTNLSLLEYFRSNGTWQYLNGIAVLGITFSLPGVFTNNFATSVNGSLWTLPYEVFAYLLVALLGKSKLLTKKAYLITLFFSLIGVFIATNWVMTDWILFGLNVHLLSMFLAFFMAGVLLFVYRELIQLNLQGAFLAGSLTLISIPLNLFQLISFFTLPYLVVGAGALVFTKLHYLSRYGDYSYGLYIFAWPVQQMIVAGHQNNIGHNRLFVYSFVITLVLAILSWHLVEKQALRFKGWFAKERYPVSGDAW